MTIHDLLKKTPVLFDGGTGTEFQKRGLKIGDAPESLTLTHKDIVRQVHRDYLDAGSQVIETNTFGGNRKRLESAGLANRIVEVNSIAVEIALQEAGGKAVVAGSIGPLGVLLEPYGDVSQTEAMEMFGEQASILLRSGIGFILIETMISLEEATLALRSVKEAGAVSIGVTLTFEMSGDEPRTTFGETARLCAEVLANEGASLVGSNCGNGFEVMRSVSNSMKESSKVPLLIQPNAGIPAYSEGRPVYTEGPTEFASFVREMRSAGVDCLGGCCGTTPDHIRSAARVLFGH